MSILESKEWAKVLQCFSAVNLHNDEWAIAGGFARDEYFGKTPKDLDVGIFDLPPEVVSEIVSYLEYEGLVEKNYFKNDLGEFVEIKYTENSIQGVLTLKGGIDLIFTEYSNVTKWVASFDYNINQFVKVIGEPAKFVGKNLGTLVYLGSNSVCPVKLQERKAKFLNYRIQVGWSVDKVSIGRWFCDLEILQYAKKGRSLELEDLIKA